MNAFLALKLCRKSGTNTATFAGDTIDRKTKPLLSKSIRSPGSRIKFSNRFPLIIFSARVSNVLEHIIVIISDCSSCRMLKLCVTIRELSSDAFSGGIGNPSEMFIS